MSTAPARVRADAAPAARDEARFAIAVALAHLVAVAAAALVHEPWRDEVEAWLVARDTASPLALLHQLRYEGHPSLWYVVLWPLTRLGGPALMQGAAALIATASTYVFARFAPFPRLARALFAFGVLQVWEWGAIARNYGLGALFLFGAAALAVRRERHPLLLGAALALAANTSLHAALVAQGVLALLALETLARVRGSAQRRPSRAWWCGLGLGALGQVACALTIWPPRDSGIAAMWKMRDLGDRLGKTLAAPVHGFATLAWADALERFEVLRGVQIAAGVAATVALVAAAGLVLARRRGAWVVAAIPAASLLALFFFRWYGGTRHAAFLLLGLLIALWIAPTLPLRGRVAGPATALAEQRLGSALALVLALQVVSAVIQAAIDARGVYSAGRATAALIRESGLAGLPLVADPDSSASNVVGELGVRRAFYANVGRWGSFPIFDASHGPANPHPDRAPDAEVFARAEDLARGTPVVVVVDREADAAAVAACRARFVGARRADIRRDESFWVYLVPASAPRQGAPAAFLRSVRPAP